MTWWPSRRDQTHRWYAFDNKDSAASRRILEASKDEQRGFVLAAAEWLDLRHGKKSAAFYETWVVRQTMQTVLRRRLPFDHDDIGRLLDWSIRQPYTSRARNTTDDQGAHRITSKTTG